MHTLQSCLERSHFSGVEGTSRYNALDGKETSVEEREAEATGLEEEGE